MPRGKTFTPVILLEVLLKGAGKLSFKKVFLRLRVSASYASSDVKVFCKFCVFLYKDAARLDLVAHKEREGLVTR